MLCTSINDYENKVYLYTDFLYKNMINYNFLVHFSISSTSFVKSFNLPMKIIEVERLENAITEAITPSFQKKKKKIGMKTR